ncbi:hypothetical protein C3Y87_15425 [Carbonactinospora thermoautotrophica]|uniref:Uncharacterized protein n=1 Tax=Carbonactinospora thermoautotrophica TaxID=1469144 RepID=A0A132MTY8_9ACTN|nr:hypothetical protein [Carbonactinospora thermoautotrophica]KWX01327.1 Uncharacterized protein LI90_2355 [Carbonactinospora thermoautotrophica]MCX9192778.1 hypothetical protein [Carbonactinospora thermoautotrophica]
MSQVSPPTPDRVRAAAEALKNAIDRHLAAVEQRKGESDPVVFQAFEELQAAAEAYDDLLYDAYEEVTPFEFGDSAEEPEELEAVSIRIRRDYLIEDSDAVLAAAREAFLAERPGVSAETAAEAIKTVESAVATLFDAYEPDALDEHAEKVGLAPVGSTLWVVATEPHEDDEWLDEPFRSGESERVIYRLDVTVRDEAEGDDDNKDD